MPRLPGARAGLCIHPLQNGSRGVVIHAEVCCHEVSANGSVPPRLPRKRSVPKSEGTAEGLQGLLGGTEAHALQAILECQGPNEGRAGTPSC